MQTWQYRDGDIVEVTPRGPGVVLPADSFQGVVDSRRKPPGRPQFSRATDWVWVRKGDDRFSGGWEAAQCRLILRPKPEPTPPLPALVELGEN